MEIILAIIIFCLSNFVIRVHSSHWFCASVRILLIKEQNYVATSHKTSFILSTFTIWDSVGITFNGYELPIIYNWTCEYIDWITRTTNFVYNLESFEISVQYCRPRQQGIAMAMWFNKANDNLTNTLHAPCTIL